MSIEDPNHPNKFYKQTKVLLLYCEAPHRGLFFKQSYWWNSWPILLLLYSKLYRQ